MAVALGTAVVVASQSATNVASFSVTVTAAAGSYIDWKFMVANNQTLTFPASNSFDGVNAYTQAGSKIDDTTEDKYVYQFHTTSAVAGGSYTLTVTFQFADHVFIGIATPILNSSGFDTSGGQAQATPGTGANIITTGTMTPSFQPGLILGACFFNAASLSAGTSPNAFTLSESGSSSTSLHYLSEYFNYSALTALAATFGQTTSNSGSSVATLWKGLSESSSLLIGSNQGGF